MSILQILGLVYIAFMLLCFFEAYFYTKLDPESQKFIRERENKNKIK